MYFATNLRTVNYWNQNGNWVDENDNQGHDSSLTLRNIVGDYVTPLFL
jgi:hypothetical protein